MVKTFDEIKKFNPYHGNDGRFTSAGSAASFTYKPGQGKMYDNAIARERERTKKLVEADKKMQKVTLSADNMPKLFTSTKANAKSMANFCAAINACKDADPDCVKVLSKISTEPYTQNLITPKLSNAKGHSITSSYSPITGELRAIKITIPKVTDADDISSVVTTAHELTHFADITIGGEGRTATYASARNQTLMAAVSNGRNANQGVSDETAALFKDMNDYYVQSVAQRRAELKDRIKAIDDSYGLGPNKSLWNLSRSEVTAYQKEANRAQKEYSQNIDHDIRTYKGGAMTSLSDMYDAMCAGAKTMKGTTLVSGHSTKYFQSVSNRTEELLANYVTIGATNPGLLKHFKRDYPEVYSELEKQVHKMAES